MQTSRGYPLMADNEGDKPQAVNDAVQAINDDVGVLLAASSGGVRVALNVAETTDFANNMTIVAGAWTTVGTQRTFNTSWAGSIVEIAALGAIKALTLACVNGDIAARLLIDSGLASEQAIRIGGDYKRGTTTADSYRQPLAGSSPVPVSGLAVGAHTVELQFNPFEASDVTCLASSVPTWYFLRLWAKEIKVAA